MVVIGSDARPGPRSAHLLALLTRALDEQPTIERHVILLRGGSEIHRFHELAPTTVVEWFDRTDDNREMAKVVRNPLGRRLMAHSIGWVSAAALPQRLPDLPGATTLICGWEALAHAPLPARTPRDLLGSRGRPRDMVIDLLGEPTPSSIPLTARLRLRLAGTVVTDETLAAVLHAVDPRRGL